MVVKSQWILFATVPRVAECPATIRTVAGWPCTIAERPTTIRTVAQWPCTLLCSAINKAIFFMDRVQGLGSQPIKEKFQVWELPCIYTYMSMHTDDASYAHKLLQTCVCLNFVCMSMYNTRNYSMNTSSVLYIQNCMHAHPLVHSASI